MRNHFCFFDNMLVAGQKRGIFSSQAALHATQALPLATVQMITTNFTCCRTRIRQQFSNMPNRNVTRDVDVPEIFCSLFKMMNTIRNVDVMNLYKPTACVFFGNHLKLPGNNCPCSCRRSSAEEILHEIPQVSLFSWFRACHPYNIEIELSLDKNQSLISFDFHFSAHIGRNLFRNEKTSGRIIKTTSFLDLLKTPGKKKKKHICQHDGVLIVENESNHLKQTQAY